MGGGEGNNSDADKRWESQITLGIADSVCRLLWPDYCTWRPRGGSRRLVVVDVRIVRAPETRDNKVPFSPLGNVETWLARNVYDDNNSMWLKIPRPFTRNVVKQFCGTIKFSIAENSRNRCRLPWCIYLKHIVNKAKPRPNTSFCIIGISVIIAIFETTTIPRNSQWDRRRERKGKEMEEKEK